MPPVLRGLLVGAFAGAVLGALARALMRLVAIGMGVGTEPEFHLGPSLAIVGLFVLSGAGAGVAGALETQGWLFALVLVLPSIPLFLMGSAFTIGETNAVLDLGLTPPWTAELLALAAVIVGLALVTPYAGWRAGRAAR